MYIKQVIIQVKKFTLFFWNRKKNQFFGFLWCFLLVKFRIYSEYLFDRIAGLQVLPRADCCGTLWPGTQCGRREKRIRKGGSHDNHIDLVMVSTVRRSFVCWFSYPRVLRSRSEHVAFGWSCCKTSFSDPGPFVRIRIELFFPESGSAKNRILEKNGKKLYVQVQKYV